MDIIYSEKISADAVGIVVTKDNYDTLHSSEWDDFDYKVKFKIFYKKDESDNHNFLGYIRILVQNNKNTFEFFKKNGKRIDENNYGISHLFTGDVVSCPLDIEFYEKINKIFNSNPDDIDIFLDAMKDASYLNSGSKYFSSFDGYACTILREGSTAQAILAKGYGLAIGRPLLQSKFEVKIETDSNKFDTLTLKFDNTRKFGRRNINLLVGRNGSGKTFLMDNIVKNVLGLSTKKIDFPYFNKVIMCAFSPFEEFLTEFELGEKFKEANSNNTSNYNIRKRRLPVNKYTYIGFKDEESRFNINYPKLKSVKAILDIIKYDSNIWWAEFSKKKLLEDTLKLSVDFDDIMLKLRNGEYVSINNIGKELFNKISEKEGIFFKYKGEIVKLSSGQQIYSYLIPQLISEIEKETLILIDEPELYLHPGLELGLIKMIKKLLDEFKSFAVIATHSSILTREIDREAVNIFKRQANYTYINNASIETYGSDLEKIIVQVFEDDLEKKIYEGIIDEKIGDITINEVSTNFGDAGMIYYLSKDQHDSFEFEE